jgi:hypothetical protein
MQQLAVDPRSRFHAAINGWEHPVQWADMVLMDAFDLTASRYVARSKFKPYPRPWTKSVRVNKKSKRTAREVLARLRPNRQRPLPPPPA